MKLKKIVANYIWRIREDVGINGNSDHDWWLAGEFLSEYKNSRFDYDDVYIWLMERNEEGV